MSGAESTASPILRMEGVSKRYGGVRALADADLTVFAGRIHAILGENGAGKSTLIKILSGVVAPDAGRIVLDGAEVAFDSPAAANRAGIVCIFQELSLVPDLSVADNIAISNPPRRFGMIDRRAQRRLAEEALERAGATDIHPMALVKDLALSRRQMVEIAKALARKPARPHSRRGDFGADRRRRRQGVRRPQAPARRRGLRFSTFPIACTRSPSLPTKARCSGTASMSRPTRPERRATTRSSR